MTDLETGTKSQSRQKPDPLVSIIIPTCDKDMSAAEKCIISIKASSYKNTEIILVIEGKERSAQRNIGMRRAGGKFYMFLDSDQSVSEKLIEACVKQIKWHSGLYIPEIITAPGWFGCLRAWERLFYEGTAVDVVRFVRAYECPNFDETMSGPEDSDFDRQIIDGKVMIKQDKGNLYYIQHEDNVGMLQYFKKKKYYCKSMDRFRQKWPHDKILNFWWRCFGVFLENGKWRILIRKPHYALAMFLMIAIRGFIYKCLPRG